MNYLKSQEARIKALEDALRGMKELAEFWINREDTRDISKERYEVWLALGHRSKAMERAREVLGDNVEFSGVPAGQSSNHPAGCTSAATQG